MHIRGITKRWLINSLGLIVIILVILILSFAFVVRNYYYNGIQSTIQGHVSGISSYFSGSLDDYSKVAFGCPAMGDEVLEESEFAPMFDECKPELTGKKVALFGSYGWGTGEWMENWEADCAASGIKLATDSVIANEMPDEEALAACKALGAALV